jgi:hypothetical protein
MPGIDPERASFTTALHTATQALIQADGVLASGPSPAGRIGRAVLDDLLPPRRPRVSGRKVKSPLSRWNNTPIRAGRPAAPPSPG